MHNGQVEKNLEIPKVRKSQLTCWRHYRDVNKMSHFHAFFFRLVFVVFHWKLMKFWHISIVKTCLQLNLPEWHAVVSKKTCFLFFEKAEMRRIFRFLDFVPFCYIFYLDSFYVFFTESISQVGRIQYIRLVCIEKCLVDTRQRWNKPVIHFLKMSNHLSNFSTCLAGKTCKIRFREYYRLCI